MTRASSQKGAALILVLWTFTVLSALAAEFARAMREDAQSTSNFKQETIAHYVAIAGINEAMLAIHTYNGELDLDDDVSDDEEEDDERRADELLEDEDAEHLDVVEMLLDGRGDWVDATFKGVDYQVRAVDETGKIPLNANAVDAALLRQIMVNLEYEELVAETVADSIVDWRDEDDLHGLNGAEDDYYGGLTRPYESKDAPFDSVEELLLVRGVTREMFHGTDETPGLKDIFSVIYDRPRLTLRSIPRAVEHALCGITYEDEDGYEAEEELGADSGEDEETLAACLASLGLGSRSGERRGRATLGTATVEARVRDKNERVLTHVGTTVQFKGGGFQTFQWYDAVYTDERS